MYDQDIKITKSFVATFVVLSLSFFAFNVFVSCKSKDIKPVPQPVEQMKPNIPDLVQIPLPWEKNHPERIEWTTTLYSLIDQKFASLKKAKDMGQFCPKYYSLRDDQKKIAWALLFDSIVYYESGYNPKSSSVDVGSKSDKNTWSVGLFQISSTDSKNWKIPFSFSYEELKDPKNNMKLALEIFSKQLDRQNLIVVTKSLYWAVIGKPPYKYSKVPQIIKKMKVIDFCQ
jgi:hypothetical protein